MLVKDNWQVVQCSKCEKINKVPGVVQTTEDSYNTSTPEISYPYIVMLY
jgi:hypothetical protein